MISNNCLFVPSPSTSTLVVCIHGSEGSKQDWSPHSGTILSELCVALQSHGISWLAHDLYGHGTWQADDDTFEVGDISEDHWPDFITESVTALRNAIHSACQQYPIQELIFVAYSTGNSVLVKVLAEVMPVPVKALIMASVLPEQEMNDEYALHNNLAVFENQKIHLHSGFYDPDTNPIEIRWFFDILPTIQKDLFTYNSGHELPAEWINQAIDLIISLACCQHHILQHQSISD